jgi:outer membrane protein TolC
VTPTTGNDQPARRALCAAALAVLLALPATALAQAPAAALAADPVLERLVEESLAARPELRAAEAAVQAERERVPQAGALPDPVLSLGIQNDGFDRIAIGEMESSYWQVMLSQGLPWPGKRGLRTDAARLAVSEAEAARARARLSTEADVRRAYLDLLVARERLGLLDRLTALWQKSGGVVRARYEAGDGAQSDVLRAQLELNRLKQRRWALEAQERASVHALNRLRDRPLDEAIATSASVRGLPLPALPPLEDEVADALARSPELAQARAAVARAGKEAALARRERYPDLAVSAGVMPRGSLDPMWQAGISVGLPVWSSRKQSRAAAEGEARAETQERRAAAVEQLVRLRVAERRAALEALADTLRLYRDGLLVQSQATAESTLAQYRVGKVTFASVLDANAGYIGDEDGFLAAAADAQRLAIAGAEVSLEPPGAPGAGARMGGAAMPGTGPAGSAMGGGSPSPSAPAGAASSAPSMSSM